MVQKDKIRAAVVGVGNCASSLIQGIYYYSDRIDAAGLIRKTIAGYEPSSIQIVAAFDIDARKIGLDVSEAIFAKPNNAVVFCQNIPMLDVKVLKGPTMDGFSEHMLSYPEDIRFVESDLPAVDVVKVLNEIKPDVLINYLPVGSENAARFYADCCLEAGVSFINAMPVFICSAGDYAAKFKKRGLICVGDDIKSQFGATIIHRSLINLMENRGIRIKRTYQLNTGGNTDFLNMLNRERLVSKKISKTESVQSQMSNRLEDQNIHIGPSDFVQWQKDNKICFLRIEGETFGDLPIDIDIRLSVEDSPNSAGVMIDVIRCVKFGLIKGLSGDIEEVSSYAFKHPRKQHSDFECVKIFNDFVLGR